METTTRAETRNTAAKMLYEADLDLTGATVKQIVDLMEDYGNLRYRKAVLDLIIGQVEDEVMEND